MVQRLRYMRLFSAMKTRALLIVAYAVANATALVLTGTASCGMHLDWYLSTAALAAALATLQSLVVVPMGVRARAWWPLTFMGTVTALPVGLTAIYVFAVGFAALNGFAGAEEPSPIAGILILSLPVVAGAIVVGGLQLLALGPGSDAVFAPWIATNALAGFVSASAIESILFACSPVGMGPPWLESPIGWAVAGIFAGVLTGLVLTARRVTRPEPVPG